MDFANGPSISKALGTNCPVQKRPPSNLTFQAVRAPNSHSFLASGVPPGAHSEAVDGEYDAGENTLQLRQVELTANPSRALSRKHLTALAFSQLAWDEINDFVNKFSVLSRDSAIFLKGRVAQGRWGERACEPRTNITIIMQGSDGM